MTEWNEFREPDFAKMRQLLRSAGRLRRPQHLLARAHARARLHVLLHWPLSAAPVLVTGGAGYIGSHAAKALQRGRLRVVVFDNLSPAIARPSEYGELVEGDITDVRRRRGAMLRHHEISAVMHFAAFLDVGESVREPVRYYRNNVVGALSVLEAMAAESVR